jgi:putative FmdB family regulatory protein
MPIYPYRCGDCGQLTDLFASIDSPADPIECEHCHSRRTQRVIGRVAYHASANAKSSRLDPKYEKMVDDSLRKSASADPDRLLRRMKPFSPAKD